MPTTDRENLIQEILILADNLFRKLLPAVPKDLLTLEVTMSQLKIMLLLFIQGAMRMGAIAAALEVTLPTATNLVDRLTEKDYITRENQSDDRRVVLCRLSAKGQNAIDRIWESGKNRSQDLLEKMDTIKLKMFVQVLKSMLESEGG